MSMNLTMPRLSDTMTTGKVLSWNKKVGDRVQPGDVLAEIESDKATMEFEAFDEGILLEIRVPAGEAVAIGTILAVLGEATESIPATPPTAKPELIPVVIEILKPAPVPEVIKPVEVKPVEQLEKQNTLPTPPESGRILASPIALRLAAELAIDLRQIQGSGPDGRITRVDVETAAGKNPTPLPIIATVAKPTENLTEPSATKSIEPSTATSEPLSQMRSAIARRMTEGWQTPMFTVAMEIAMDRVVDLRQQWKSIGTEVVPSINDFIVSACAKALRKFPRVNASYAGDKILLHETQDIAIAVSLDDGLITPVIRNAGSLSLHEIASEAKRLSNLAREHKLQPEEFSGSTFTISNLGMYDVIHFTAIVNPPEAAILAVGSIREVPISNSGTISFSQRMVVTLSGDHRVIDGATGAQFLKEVKKTLESPVSLL